MIDITQHYNKIINGDCTKVLKEFPDKSIDLTITDFPYGCNEIYDSITDTQENLKVLIPLAMEQILRVSKVTYITCGSRNMFLYPQPDWVMCWYIPGGVGHSSYGFNTWQPILVYGDDPYIKAKLGARPDGYYGNLQSEKNFHPCPKEETFWEWLLLRGSPFETDIILDPFFGSGMTGIVSRKNNRRYIGIELSKYYCEEAQKLIDNRFNYNSSSESMLEKSTGLIKIEQQIINPVIDEIKKEDDDDESKYFA